jgi:hypothetical protein
LVGVQATDLNGYAPSHSSRYCGDWTGDYDIDFERSRAKRFLINTPEQFRALRRQLGTAADLGPRVTMAELQQAGADLAEPTGGDESFFTMSYVMDSGSDFTSAGVPIYLRGRRWGSAIVSWQGVVPDDV